MISVCGNPGGNPQTLIVRQQKKVNGRGVLHGKGPGRERENSGHPIFEPERKSEEKTQGRFWMSRAYSLSRPVLFGSSAHRSLDSGNHLFR